MAGPEGACDQGVHGDHPGQSRGRGRQPEHRRQDQTGGADHQDRPGPHAVQGSAPRRGDHHPHEAGRRGVGGEEGEAHAEVGQEVDGEEARRDPDGGVPHQLVADEAAGRGIAQDLADHVAAEARLDPAPRSGGLMLASHQRAGEEAGHARHHRQGGEHQRLHAEEVGALEEHPGSKRHGRAAEGGEGGAPAEVTAADRRRDQPAHPGGPGVGARHAEGDVDGSDRDEEDLLGLERDGEEGDRRERQQRQAGGRRGGDGQPPAAHAGGEPGGGELDHLAHGGEGTQGRDHHRLAAEKERPGREDRAAATGRDDLRRHPLRRGEGEGALGATALAPTADAVGCAGAGELTKGVIGGYRNEIGGRQWDGGRWVRIGAPTGPNNFGRGRFHAPAAGPDPLVRPRARVIMKRSRVSQPVRYAAPLLHEPSVLGAAGGAEGAVLWELAPPLGVEL